MKEKNIRSFIAIPLPTSVQQTLESWAGQIKQRQKSGVKWVNTSNLHLTLKFLGEIQPVQVATIHQEMLKTAADFTDFTFDLQGIGAFPGLNKPRVIWAGIKAPPQLQEIYQDLEDRLFQLGFPREERPFSPHLTLGRVERTASQTEIAHLSAILREPNHAALTGVAVSALHLYRSDLRPAGPVYTLLQHAPLKSNSK